MKKSFVILLLIMIAAEIALFVFIGIRGVHFINSDDASELVLANILADQHGIITRDWYYSTELRFLNTNLVNAPLFMIFHNWRLVRMLSLVILNIVLSLSVFYLCFKGKAVDCFPIASLMVLLPTSLEYYKMVSFGTFYIPHIVISFTGIGLIFGIISLKGFKKYILMAVSFILAFLSCIGGARQIVILYLPLLLTSVLLLTGKADGEEKSKYKSILLTAVINLIGAGLGYVVNSKVLAGHYHFQQWNDISFTGFNLNNFVSVFNDFLISFGYEPTKVGLRCVLSNILTAVIVITVIVAVVYPLRKKEKVSFEYYFLDIFFLSNVFFFIVLYTFSSMQYRNRYNFPIIVFAYLLIAFWIKESDILKSKKLTMMLLYSAIFIMASFLVCGPYFKQITKEKNDEREYITKQVLSDGYNYGYAPFWQSNILIEYSNGLIDMHSVDEFWPTNSESGSAVVKYAYPWLQAVEHDNEIPTGKVFVLMTSNEYNNWNLKQYLTDEYAIYSSQSYKAFGFENYETMLQVLDGERQ